MLRPEFSILLFEQKRRVGILFVSNCQEENTTKLSAFKRK
jgi:hypothetical protein